MSAAPVTQETPRITVDDLRRKAESIRDMAKDDAMRVVREDSTQLVIAGAVLVAVALSVAYFAGSRAGARAMRRRRPQPTPPSA